MAFTIPNEAAAAFVAQAEPDSVHFDVLAAGIGGTCVVSGCAVTAQGIADNTVAVAAGEVIVAGTKATVASGNLTIATGHITLPRFDLISASNAGVKVVTAGTAAANPLFPAVPANSVALAVVYVPTLDIVIAANQIYDLRLIVPFAVAGSGRVAINPAPTLTTDGAGADPALGTGGSIAGRVGQLGKEISATINVLFGSSGVSAGSGAYRITLPVNAHASEVYLGDGMLFDSSAGLMKKVSLIKAAASTFAMYLGEAGAGAFEVTNAVPFIPAANDQMWLKLGYEAA